MPDALSIAVVSYNTRDLTARCLQAAEAAVRRGSASLLLVDNGSADGTVELARDRFPAWRVMTMPQNPGYGAALNCAFRSAPARHFLALNSDVLLHVDAIDILVSFLHAHPQCAVAGPSLAYPDGRLQPSAKRFHTLPLALGEVFHICGSLPRSRALHRFYYGDQDLATHPWVDGVSGAAMLIRGEAFQRIGGFDEGFRMYFEETDLCRRLHDAGYRVALCSKATATHWHGASSAQTSVRQVDYYVSYVRFFRKHYGPGPARILAAAVVLSTVLRAAALPVKYPPLSRRQLDLLRSKLSACRCLLASLLMPGGQRTAARIPS